MENAPEHLLSFLGLKDVPPDRVVFSDNSGVPATYGDLVETLDRIDAALEPVLPTALGIRPRIITLFPDGPAVAAILLGLLDRATLIPTNPALKTAELIRLTQDVGAEAIAVLEGHEPGEVAAASLGLPVIRFARLPSHCAAATVKDVPTIPTIERSGEADALILSTSGSTGTPKAVPLTSAALRQSSATIARTLELGPDDIAFHILPMFHIGAIVDLVLAPLSKGGSVHFAERGAVDDIVVEIQNARPTWLQTVPTIMGALLSQGKNSALAGMSGHLRFIRSVSADLPPALHEEAETRFGRPIIQMYGMTETAGQIASMELPPARRPLGSVGRVIGPDVVILDSDGNPVPMGESGEVCVKGETVMRGYLGSPPGTGFFGEWLRTGDTGYLDDDGFLYLTGRLKDQINRGGEKIAPQEIERALLECDDVLEAVAYASPHATLGEEPAASVVMRPDSKKTERDLVDHLSTRLADFKVPRHIAILPAFPRLGSGKIDRRKVADAAAGADQHAEALPDDAEARRVVRAWATVLNDKAPTASDDFFDAGGDSLLATTLLLRLEKALGKALPPEILFENPTLKELIEAIRDLPHATKEHDPMIDAVRRATAGWSGRRSGLSGLLHGYGLVSDKNPFFFCVQAEGEFQDFADEMAGRRPVYVMRSLSRLYRFKALSGMRHFPFARLKSDENTDRLADIYATDIDDICSEGPIYLGGFCQGAVVARRVAAKLLDRGRDVALMVIADRIFFEPTEVPTLLLWSSEGPHTGVTQFIDPAQQLDAVFRGGVRLETFEARHITLMQGKRSRQMADIVENAISTPPSPPDQVDPVLDRQSTSIRIAAPVFARPGQSLSVRVTIVNTSAHDWPPTGESGLHLALRWVNIDGHIRVQRAASAPLPMGLASGQSTTLTVDVAFPEKRLPLMLLADMVEDGVCWFHWASGRATRRLVLPNPF